MIIIRDPEGADWIPIASLADKAIAHVPGAPRQVEWVQNRLEFTGARRHYVVEDDGYVVGYGSIEKPDDDSTNGFRLFLVLRWLDGDSSRIAGELLERLRHDVVQLEIKQVWVREYAEDQPFIEFLLSRGFELTKEYEFDGNMLVNLRATKGFLAA